KPGVIAVNKQGKRFTNEANSYHDFIQAMVETCKNDDEVSTWLLCDHKALRTYGLGCVPPFPMPIGRYVKSGYLKQGQTIEELAQKIHVPAATLKATIERFNKDAARGEDPE